MISILDIAPNVLGYRAEGRLERADIEQVFAEVDRKLSGPTPVRIFAEVLSLSGISLEALWKDIVGSIKRWDAVRRIDRAALVTDIDWLHKAAIWEDRVFASIHIRTFTLAQREEALEWVQSDDAASPGDDG